MLDQIQDRQQEIWSPQVLPNLTLQHCFDEVAQLFFLKKKNQMWFFFRAKWWYMGMNVGYTQKKMSTNLLSYTCFIRFIRLCRGHIPSNYSFAWSSWRDEHLTQYYHNTWCVIFVRLCFCYVLLVHSSLFPVDQNPMVSVAAGIKHCTRRAVCRPGFGTVLSWTVGFW